MRTGLDEYVNHIGQIIRRERTRLGMSRSRLAEHICSEKHIYLIEKGERSPSAVLTGLLGDKLSVDLFGFRHYLNGQDPVAVREGVECFRRYRRSKDLAALQDATERFRMLPDFQTKPWIYEVEINDLYRLAYEKCCYADAVAGILYLLARVESRAALIELRVLLSDCYLQTGELAKAKAVAERAALLFGESCESRLGVAVRCALLSVYWACGQYRDVVATGESLMQYQREHQAFERMHETFFLLALAYFKTGLFFHACDCFRKGLHSVMVFDRQADMKAIRKMSGFAALLDSAAVDAGLAAAFKRKYAESGVRGHLAAKNRGIFRSMPGKPDVGFAAVSRIH